MDQELQQLVIQEEELKALTELPDFKKLKKVGVHTRLPDESDCVIRPSEVEMVQNAKSSIQAKYRWKHLYPKLLMYTVITALFMILSRFTIGIPIGTFLSSVLVIFFGVAGVKNLMAIKRAVSDYIDSLRPTPIGTLLDEVENYNIVVSKIISHIRVTDKLRDIGHPIKIKDIKPILDIFKDIRSDLIRALKTERVFRDNPDVKLDDFSIDFMPYRALEFDEQAKECEVLVNQALEIGGRVQSKMRNILEEIESSQRASS